ncbi:MAG: SIS domain-containing protein, partial [Rhodanobacteraceae bacterium]
MGQELNHLLSQIDPVTFRELVNVFEDTQCRWFFTGQGRSGLVAQMAAMRFMHLGRTVHVVGDATAPSIRQGDGMVIVSGSGETPVGVGFGRIARAEQARLVLLTHKPRSTLAGIADIVLPVSVAGTVQFGGSLFEQASLLLLDAVVLLLMRRLPDANA